MFVELIKSKKDGTEAYLEKGNARVFRLADPVTGYLDYCFLADFDESGARARWYGFMGKIDHLKILS